MPDPILAPTTQDPLPESQWLFRRIYTWSLSVLLLTVLGVVVWRMPPAMLQLVALWLIGLLALLVTYYLLAPSAIELARLIRALRAPAAEPGDPR